MNPINPGPERDLQSALDKTRTELSRAIRERDLWNIRIMQLEMNVKSIHSALAKGLTGQDQSVIGVTEAIRTVMRSWGKPMTPQEVRLALVAAGFDLTRFKNPSAAIANTLLRMVKSGELQPNAKAKTFWLPINYHDAVLQAVEEIRKDGSEVGSPLSIENEDERSLRRKK